jgi:sulfatase modifying factor 1
MVFVPEGVYFYGARDAVYVAAYEIDRDEVSEAGYKRCVLDGVCQDYPYLNRPGDTPVRATWSVARAYCAWRGARLPTEIEWEVAARGRYERPYPWGDTMIDDCELVRTDRCAPADVDAFTLDVSPFGARNMFGNATEWVADFASNEGRSYRHRGARAARGLGDKRGFRTFWNADWSTWENWDRRASYPLAFHGFRCARSIAVGFP